MMPGVNYVIYGCPSARTSPGVSLYRNLILEKKYCCSYNLRQMLIWKNQLKAKLADYSYQRKFFNILAIGQKYFSFYLPSLLNIYSC